MPDKGWSRKFDDPIPLPSGRQLVTLKDAATYKVFASENAAEEWFEENDPEGVAFEYPVIGDRQE